MRQNIITILLSCAILAALYFTFIRTDKPDPAAVEVSSLPADSSELMHAETVPRISAPDTRRIVEIPFESITTLRLDSLLYWPFEVIVDGGDIYISDLERPSVMRFTLEGAFVAKIATGPGNGPGEVTEISDFVKDDAHLWLTGPNLYRVNKYTLDGTFVEQFRVDNSPFRLAKTETSLIIAGLDPSSFIFSAYSMDNAFQYEFGAYVANQGNVLTTQGHLATDGDNLYFATMYASYIYTYSNAGILARVIETVDRFPFPSSTITKSSAGQPLLRSPRQETVIFDIEIDDGIIYTNSAVAKTPPYSIIDSYDLESGHYLSSAHLPIVVRKMDVVNRTIYAAADTSVIVFDYPDINYE